jgi:hypothetical protein
MPLSKAVRMELEAELENLGAEKKRLTAAIDSKIEHIKAILEDEFYGPLKVDAKATGVLPDKPAVVVGKNGKGGGLRHYLWQVFDAHPGGLKAKEVVEWVSKLGYKPSGKTTANTMVYAELYRLKRQHRLVKTASGRFRPRLETPGDALAN